MKNPAAKNSQQNSNDAKRAPYEAPAIIYEGLITTRAGSVLPESPGTDGSGGGGGDPANIFGGPGG